MTACAFCGTELPEGALFCGECGRSVASAGRVPAAVTVPRSSLRLPEAEVPAIEEPEVEQPEFEQPEFRQPEFEQPEFEQPEDEKPEDEGHPEEGALTCFNCGSAVSADDVFCPVCGMLLAAKPVELPDSVGSSAPTMSVPTVPSVPTGSSPSIEERLTQGPLIEDLEVTRLVVDTGTGERYVLQFSTGESVTVRGSGLIGRNPSPEPGEFVDQLVALFDAGKSVSKTHLEFGQESGRFWVSDRFSTNGSVVRAPDADARRCEPGRRYLVSRGTRVDIGEQFFVVS